MKTRHDFPIYQVDWHDAQTHHGWTAVADIDPAPPLVTTIGFLVKRGRHAIVISSTVGQGEANSHITIPLGMIQGMCEVKLRHLRGPIS